MGDRAMGWIMRLGGGALSVAVCIAFAASLTSQPTTEALATVTQIAVRATLTAWAADHPSATPHFVVPADTPTEPPPFPSFTPSPTRTPTPSPSPTASATATIPITPATITPEGVGAPGAVVAGQPTAVVHIVGLRESLSRIAGQYAVSVEAVAAANALADPNRIFVGQALLIPVGGTVQPPMQTATTVYPAQATAQAMLLAAGVSLNDDYLALPMATPTLPPPTSVNGLDIAHFVVISDAAAAQMRAIFARGSAMGRDPRAFSKLGDSTIENPYFLTRFDGEDYHLGDYGHLAAIIAHYRGSFERQGVAVRRGLHTWSVLDPMWAPKPPCVSGEHMLACEFRLHNPSVLIVRMGSNDAGIPDATDKNLRRIVEYAIESGVIPLMATKADRFEGPDNTNNRLIRQIAQDYALPLWDFDLVAGTLPGRGLGPDRVHMTTYYPHDWRAPLAFQTGNGVHNLTALIALEKVWGLLGRAE